MKKEDWPKSVEEAVDILLKVLPDTDIEKIKSERRDKLAKFHFTIGWGIRNNFGLWTANNELNYSCCAAMLKSQGLPYDNSQLRLMDPDRCSTIIMEQLWDRLNNK